MAYLKDVYRELEMAHYYVGAPLSTLINDFAWLDRQPESSGKDRVFHLRILAMRRARRLNIVECMRLVAWRRGTRFFVGFLEDPSVCALRSAERWADKSPPLPSAAMRAP